MGEAPSPCETKESSLSRSAPTFSEGQAILILFVHLQYDVLTTTPPDVERGRFNDKQLFNETNRAVLGTVRAQHVVHKSPSLLVGKLRLAAISTIHEG